MPIKKEDFEIIKKIAKSVDEQGGKVYFVGGCVRDKIMGKDFSDVDIEVHGIDVPALEDILDKNGQKTEFGKSFGVYSLKGCSIDIAMPRREHLTGCKHTDFKIDVDPFLGTEKAARRRDFTMNALMEDVLSGEVCDHFGGVCDIKNGVVRHVDSQTFIEDPLRVLRAAQFAARFDFEIADETRNLCSGMDLTSLSGERVFGETKKALLMAKNPSRFFKELKKMGQLDFWFSDVKKLIGIPQNPKHHKEGDVFVHTMLVLDEAAKKRDAAVNPLGFMFSALCHDFGKITATKTVNGALHSYNHEKEGLPISREFMQKLTDEKALTRYVLNMVEMHMQPSVLAADNSSVKSTNKMFDNSAAPFDLIQLSLADNSGKIPVRDYEKTETFLIERLEIYNDYMSRPCVSGADLVKAGLTPGPEFTKLLDYAHKLHLAGVPKDAALKQTLAYNRINPQSRGRGGSLL